MGARGEDLTLTQIWWDCVRWGLFLRSVFSGLRSLLSNLRKGFWVLLTQIRRGTAYVSGLRSLVGFLRIRSPYAVLWGYCVSEGSSLAALRAAGEDLSDTQCDSDSA